MLFKKKLSKRIKINVTKLVTKISDDNLFLLSSSTSYYSTLAIAPFFLILMGIAAFLGQNMQMKLIMQAKVLSPQLGSMVKMLFANVNEDVHLSSSSGMIGIMILLWTSSMVFLQLRYSLDVIYGSRNPKYTRLLRGIITERLVAMFIMLLAGFFFLFTVFFSGFINFVMQPSSEKTLFYRCLILSINFFIYVIMFTGLHYLVPSKRPKISDAIKMALFTSVFFVLGNVFLASYLKTVAPHNFYGAAGSLLGFLTWSYYSSFILFLSVEVFLFFKTLRVVKST